MEKLIISAKREGYDTNQVGRTMTVGELTELLSSFDFDTPVYIGNDRRGAYWYTFGSIEECDVSILDDEEEDEK